MLSTVSQCLAAVVLVNVGVAYTISDGLLITHRSEIKRESKVPVVFNQTDPALMCESTFGDNAEQNADLWYGTAADYELDYFISRNNPYDPNKDNMREPGTGKGWFEKLKQTVFDADGEMPNCAQAGSGTCHVSSQVCCGVNPADPDGPKTGYKNARAYWVLKSVETLHGVFGKIHEELVQNSAINASLRLDMIKEDFSPPLETYDDIWGNLATSISFAGVYGIPDSGLFGFASGVLAIIGAFAQKEPEKPDGMTDLNEIVSTYFSGLSNTIQNILKDALGYGDQRNLPASTLTRTDDNVNQAAMFFEEGKWLFTNDDAMGSELDNIIKQSSSFVEQRLVMQAITRKNSFILIWDSRYGEPITEKYCNERKDAYKTAIWKGDFEGGKCVELLSEPDGPAGSAWPDTNCEITGSDMEPCHREPRRPTKGWMNKATDKYGVDMKMVIDSAIECAFNDPKEPDFKSVEVGGGVPHCFFNLPVKRGKWVLGNRVARHPETHEKFKMSKWESLDEVYKP
ncbi:hypothetical protein FCULG_00008989 [Fusarium culmorum]|uniref:Uncharacterized protein n=1 Tax=Fusarium culmorum TaxID=5516 RepID=A0A2T4H3I0_FUSCU|nr:hypothetical protein FCULG_00008989 [Fusarium culmorum]